MTKHLNSKFKITSKQFPEDLEWSQPPKTTFKYSCLHTYLNCYIFLGCLIISINRSDPRPITSGAQNAHAARGLDLFLGVFGEVACLHDHRLGGQLTLPSDFHVSCLHHIDHGRLVRLLLPVKACLFGNEGPEALNVDGRDNLAMLDEVEVSHANLPEETWVVLVKVDTLELLAHPLKIYV